MLLIQCENDENSEKMKKEKRKRRWEKREELNVESQSGMFSWGRSKPKGGHQNPHWTGAKKDLNAEIPKRWDELFPSFLLF
jgi:hypothetical protein